MSLLWLQRYLLNYSGAILMISHDRDFMDALVETVVEIDEKELISYTGNYSAYEKQRAARYKQKLKAYQDQKKEIDRIQEFIDRFRSVSSKASQVQSRVKQIEKMRTLEKPKAPRKIFKFHFPQPPRSNQKVVELMEVGQSYGEKRVYDGLNLVIERGDRIGLVGPNGSGKSTLLKILAGMIPIDAGEMKVGYATKLGYYSQHRSELLNENNTVLEEVTGSGDGMREDDARSLLGSFLFRREDVHKRIRVLSGGEKSRLNLVKFLVDPPNLLLMDEPTTHLDLLSIEALVLALKQYEGTLVFISHDAHFIRKLAKSIWHINNGEVTRYAGGYDYYLEKSGLMDDEKGAITAK
jgi:ATP-binding cassette subfamily F protein 3